MKTLIKNATLLDMVGEEPNLRKTDILIEENKIVKIQEEIEEDGANVIDAKEKVVMPGFVNTHTHLAMSIFRGYKDDQKLMDWLENAIFPVEDKLRPEDIYWNSFLSCIELIKTGTTTFNEMYFRMDKTIEAVEESGLRGVIAWSITDTSIKDKITRTREYHEKYNHENSRIKVYVSAHAPYSCSPDTIQLCVDLAKELNTGIHIHLSETLQEDKIIRKKYNKTGTEYLNDLHVFDVPVVLAHGIYISDSDLEILKNVKGGISHNPISNCKLSSGICNVGKLRKSGINVGLGTDGIGSTTTLDMFEEMKTAAYLQKVNTMDPTAIKAYDLLKMATIEGARVLGLEDEIGTIEVGKKADLIFINTNKTHLYPENDLCTNLVYSANGADVDTVMVDGKVIMQNRKLLHINEKDVKKNIAKVVKRLL